MAAFPNDVVTPEPGGWSAWTDAEQGNPQVAVVIPAFGSAHDLRRCLESLAKFLPSWCRVFVCDDATPDNSVRTVFDAYVGRIPDLRYHRNPRNLGFVGTCNYSVEHLTDPGEDILFLNSDAEVTEGAVEEMVRVLYLHDVHGVVTPRSNRASIYSVPVSGRLSPEDSFELWVRIRDVLPRFAVMPTAIGFCILVRYSVMAKWGLFDPIYGPGYYEETDFVARISRLGYSAVAANHAFVFHRESSSFGSRRMLLDQTNAVVLNRRYPEYESTIFNWLNFYIDPVEHFAPLFAPDRRPQILFDLSGVPPRHTAESELALNLLLHVERELRRDTEVYVTIGERSGGFFERYLRGYRRADECVTGERGVFDLVFAPSRPRTHSDFFSMVRRGIRLALRHQGLLTVRSGQLDHPAMRELMRVSTEVSDRVFVATDDERLDFQYFYGGDVPMEVIPGGTWPPEEMSRKPGRYVLLVATSGQSSLTLRALEALDVHRPVIVLGDAPVTAVFDGVTFLAEGARSRAEMDRLLLDAAAVVFLCPDERSPFSVADAVASRRPVITLGVSALVLPENQLDHVDSFTDLSEAVRRALKRASPVVEGPKTRTWQEVGVQYAHALTRLLAVAPNTDLLRHRWRVMRMLQTRG